MQFKISIVTICFNSEKTIQRTFDSVRNQSYPDIEYIVIDGCSTDSTIDIILKNNDIITKWISEKDSGISDAFNKGIEMSSGDYILILNSDDDLIPDVLKDIVYQMNYGIDIIHGNILNHKFDGRTVVAKPNLNRDVLFKYCMCLNHPGMFIKKSAYIKYGTYNTDFKSAMDRELITRMLNLGASIQYIDREIVNFYEGGLSTYNFFSKVIPEDILISKSWGANRIILLLFTIKRSVIFLFSTKIRTFINKFKHENTITI